MRKAIVVVAAVFQCLCFAAGAFAQSAPDYVGEAIVTLDPRSPGGSSGTYFETTWNDSGSAAISGGVGTYTWTQTGSVSNGVISDTLDLKDQMTTSAPLNTFTLQGNRTYVIWTKKTGTQLITFSSSSTGQISTTPGSINSHVSYNNGYDSSEAFNSHGVTGASDSVSVSASGSKTLVVASGTGSCFSTPTTTFPAYPGVTYYQLIQTSGGAFGAVAAINGTSLGTSETTGTLTITPAAPSSYTNPTVSISGPYVSGVLTTNPPAGSTVTFTPLAYDADDQGTTNGTGICTYTWSATRDGTAVTITGNRTTASLAATNPGHYIVQLTVTDNEGVQSTATNTFLVPATREKKAYPPRSDASSNPQGGDNCGMSSSAGGYGNGNASGPDGGSHPIGGDGQCSSNVDPATDDAGFVCHDPVTTRGYPLRNDISVHSVRRFSGFTTAMGNAEFTYGMRLVPVSGSPTARLVLVDAGGAEYDYGPVAGPYVPEAGVFSTLAAVGSNYVLSGAGAPGSASKAGNYTYQFDSVGELLSITDPSSNVQQVTYTSGLPSRVDDLSSGRYITFGATSGLITSISEGGGTVVTNLTYTGGALTGIQEVNSSSTVLRSLAITYNTDGTPASIIKDGDAGTEVDFTYTDSGAGYTLGNATWPSGGTTFNYFEVPGTSAVARTSRTNVQGKKTYYDYDTTGNLIRIVYPLLNGQSTATTVTPGYNASREMTSWGDGVTSLTLGYSSIGLLTSLSDNASRSWTYTYTGADLTGVSDAIGTVYTLTYGDSSNPHSPTLLTDASSDVWTYTYNAYGQMLTATPPSGAPTGTTTYAYDETSSDAAYGWMKSITDGAGDVATLDSYSPLGDVLSITTSPSSGVYESTTYAYDALRRLTLTTHPDSTTRALSYTGADLTSIADESGTLSDFTYSPINNELTEASLPLSKSLIWDLNADFEVTSFIDARNYSTTYAYGNAGELKTLTYPDSLGMAYSYRRPDEISAVSTSLSNTDVDYRRDNAGRITGVAVFGGTTYPITYTYRADDQPSQIVDQVGTRNITYLTNRWLDTVSYDDSANGLTPAQTVSYTYNADGTVATVTWKSAGTTIASWTYGYDGAGRVNSISNSFSETTSFTYDGEGKLLTQSNANGTSKAVTYNDARGWPTLLEEKLSGTDFASYALTYDSSANTVGNLTGVTEIDSSTMTYAYDALSRLTSETRTGTNPYSAKTYAYDLANNLTTVNGSTFATYDNANKFATISSGTKSYDSVGNQTGGTYSGFSFSGFSYDRRFKAVGTSPRTNIYNAEGLRGATKASSPSGQPYTFYIFDGDRIIGETTPSGATVAYTWGPNGIVSERLLGSSASLWYHFGPQGETRQLTNSSGTVVDTYRYNAWGLQLGSTGSDFNPYRYGGKFGYYADPNISNAILAGQRWYSPGLYRWLTRDPIGYDGGDNTYAYVTGNPVGFVDPDGLDGNAITQGAPLLAGAGVGGGAVVAAVFPPVVIAGSVAGIVWCLSHQEQCAAFGNKVVQGVSDQADDLQCLFAQHGTNSKENEYTRAARQQPDPCGWLEAQYNGASGLERLRIKVAQKALGCRKSRQNKE